VGGAGGCLAMGLTGHVCVVCWLPCDATARTHLQVSCHRGVEEPRLDR